MESNCCTMLRLHTQYMQLTYLDKQQGWVCILSIL